MTSSPTAREAEVRNHPKIDHSIVLGVYGVNLWNQQTGVIEHHQIEVRANGLEIAKVLGAKAIISKIRKSRSMFGAVVVTDVQKIS